MIEWISILISAEIHFLNNSALNTQAYDLNLISQILAVVICGAIAWVAFRWRQRFDSRQRINLIELRNTAYRELLAIISEYEVTHILNHDFGSALAKAAAYGSPTVKAKIDPLIKVSIFDLQKSPSFPETMTDLKDVIIGELSQPETSNR